MAPLLSIVVPTWNQAAYIEQTLASILGQNWPRLELIVIDGGSTDGTPEIVRRFPVQHFVSEPDRGQADAINKGFRLAKGDVLAWLNSDDYYLPLAVTRALAALGDVTLPALVCGDCLIWDERAGTARVARPEPFTPRVLQTSSLIYQPSAFWTRALWEKAGPLNPELHYVLDWDFWLRASRHCDLRCIPECLSVYRFHGNQKTGAISPRRTQEILQLVEENASAPWVQAFREVAARLEPMSESWKRGYRWHRLRHFDLYLRHGAKVDAAFWQLHV